MVKFIVTGSLFLLNTRDIDALRASLSCAGCSDLNVSLKGDSIVFSDEAGED